jgi:uncharacterized membrane protein
VATSKLASDLSSGSKKPEPDNSVPTSEIYLWASQLAFESRRAFWIGGWYVCPGAISRIIKQLETMRGGIIGLIGLQGVGKSNALYEIYATRRNAQDRARRQPPEIDTHGVRLEDDYDTILFKWRRHPELFASLLIGTHEASSDFRLEYVKSLSEEIAERFPSGDRRSVHSRNLNIEAEAELDKQTIGRLREISWLNALRGKNILIDTPDYSKTDRRMMAKDLEGIYWLWNTLAETGANLVVAVQKEMFRDHFFLNKMEKIELEPLQPKEMVEAYHRRFKTYEPFTEDTLLTLARMSRGIFRRFLKYITLALRYSESHDKKIIDTQTVKEAVTVERLAEDMELELAELFPKQSDLRLQAVRLLMYLEESGPKKQSELAEEFGLEEYAMSRLLAKLELHRYVVRRREGTDKIVSLRKES